jgi:hypothetical protein
MLDVWLAKSPRKLVHEVEMRFDARSSISILSKQIEHEGPFGAAVNGRAERALSTKSW